MWVSKMAAVAVGLGVAQGVAALGWALVQLVEDLVRYLEAPL